jgi:hypothetical protein
MPTTQTTVDSAPDRATFDGAKAEAFGGRMSPFP